MRIFFGYPCKGSTADDMDSCYVVIASLIFLIVLGMAEAHKVRNTRYASTCGMKSRLAAGATSAKAATATPAAKEASNKTNMAKDFSNDFAFENGQNDDAFANFPDPIQPPKNAAQGAVNQNVTLDQRQQSGTTYCGGTGSRKTGLTNPLLLMVRGCSEQQSVVFDHKNSNSFLGTEAYYAAKQQHLSEK